MINENSCDDQNNDKNHKNDSNKNHKNDYDIIIVGAGTAGCIAAITAAKKNLIVCLIDSKPKDRIGDKVCGDCIDTGSFDWLQEKLGIEHPKNEELIQTLDGMKIISPDNKTTIQIGGKDYLYMLDRHIFGQRLVNNAISAGAILLDGIHVADPIIGSFENKVIGVTVNTQKDLINFATPLGKDIWAIYGKIIIDASGVISTIREKVILVNSHLERFLDDDDMIFAYREIRELKENFIDERYNHLYFSNKIAPGGYLWYFPDGSHRVNVGLGVKRSKRYHLRERLDDHLSGSEIFEDSKILKHGGGILPTRRPMCSLVANGFMAIGDAGCQINPVDGGGISASMKGGYLAGITAVEALSKDDISQESLWIYNQRYFDIFGTVQTSLDIFRIFLQSCSDDDINFGMRYLITGERLRKLYDCEKIEISRWEKAKIVFNAARLGKLRFLRDFNSILDNMDRVK